MRILIYEHITGGGLLHAGAGVLDLLRPEGEAMLSALAGEFRRLAGMEVLVLRDARLPPLPPAVGIHVHNVSMAEEDLSLLATLAASADGTILIAPELDGILLQRARLVEKSGGRLLSPSSRVIALASDKQRTTAALRRAGVPSPRSVALESDDNGQCSLPHDFPFPAVLKRIDGAGSLRTRRVERPDEKPQLDPGPWMLEEYVPGLPTSAAVLCGRWGNVVLPPFTQHVDAVTFSYKGASRLVDPSQIERAHHWAAKAAAALPEPAGYVGVDMVLGNDPAGKEDAVIEINPRLTTSFIGLCSIARTNLASAMLAVAAGERACLEFTDDPVSFQL